MSSKTPNVDLYKADKTTDADQTFNIDTMLNENWDKLDTVIGEIRTEIGEIEPEIPEASTTQKGIVQLDDTTNSTSKGKAATADAVRRVQAAVDTKMDANRFSNLIPNSSGILGLAGWRTLNGGTWRAEKAAGDATSEFNFQQASGSEYRILESEPIAVSSGSIYNLSAEFYNVGQPDDAIYVEVCYIGGNPISSISSRAGDGWIRRGRDLTIPSGTTRIVIRLIVRPNLTASYKAFRRVQLTITSGVRAWNDDSDAFTLRPIAKYGPGFGVGEIDPNTTSEQLILTLHANAPEGTAVYYFIETKFYSSYFENRTQIAYGYRTNKICMRNYSDGVWSPWTEDLFQSVANGKNDVKQAVIANGGSVFQAGNVPTFSELATGITSAASNPYNKIILPNMLWDGRIPEVTYFGAIEVVDSGANAGVYLIAAGGGQLVKVNKDTGALIYAVNIPAASGNIFSAPDVLFADGSNGYLYIVQKDGDNNSNSWRLRVARIRMSDGIVVARSTAIDTFQSDIYESATYDAKNRRIVLTARVQIGNYLRLYFIDIDTLIVRGGTDIPGTDNAYQAGGLGIHPNGTIYCVSWYNFQTAKYIRMNETGGLISSLTFPIANQAGLLRPRESSLIVRSDGTGIFAGRNTSGSNGDVDKPFCVVLWGDGNSGATTLPLFSPYLYRKEFLDNNMILAVGMKNSRIFGFYPLDGGITAFVTNPLIDIQPAYSANAKMVRDSSGNIYVVAYPGATYAGSVIRKFAPLKFGSK